MLKLLLDGLLLAFLLVLSSLLVVVLEGHFVLLLDTAAILVDGRNRVELFVFVHLLEAIIDLHFLEL